MPAAKIADMTPRNPRNDLPDDDLRRLAKQGAKGGKVRAARMTPEERSAAARRAVSFRRVNPVKQKPPPTPPADPPEV